MVSINNKIHGKRILNYDQNFVQFEVKPTKIRRFITAFGDSYFE